MCLVTRKDQPALGLFTFRKLGTGVYAKVGRSEDWMNLARCVCGFNLLKAASGVMAVAPGSAE